MGSFTQKRLRVTLILSPQNSNGKFPGTNSNTLILTDLRTIANVQTVPGVPTHADIKLFGMDKQFMNALTTIFFNASGGPAPVIYQNSVILDQNSGNGWTQVFSGMITEAQPEYRTQPAVYFNIQAVLGYQHQINPVPPSSYQGAVGVANVVQDLAGKMGYAFENSGVTAQLNNPYFSGTYMDQLNAVCQHSGTAYVIAGDTLAIYPFNDFRAAPPMLVLSPRSGLVGYPTLEKYGIVVASVYNPGMAAGGRIKVQDSDVPNANGVWSPFMVDHQLEGNTPGGAFISVAQCQPVRQ
jgi:hypothetical protein